MSILKRKTVKELSKSITGKKKKIHYRNTLSNKKLREIHKLKKIHCIYYDVNNSTLVASTKFYYYDIDIKLINIFLVRIIFC